MDVSVSYLATAKEVDLRLRAEVERLKNAIRAHRDQHGDDRCWLDDYQLYGVLGEGQPDTSLPPKCEFLESCARFWERRQSPLPCRDRDESGLTLAQLRAEVVRLREEVRRVYGADGSSELLDTPEEVVRLRVEMAGKLERQEKLLGDLRALLRSFGQ